MHNTLICSTRTYTRTTVEYRPPLGLQVLLLIALRELTYRHVRVQPVHLRGLEVLEEKAVALAVLDARPHAAAGQHHVDDVLGVM